MFKRLTVAEVTSTLLMAETEFYNRCSKWLHYWKVDKTVLPFAGYSEIISRFVITDDIHTRYAVLTGPVLAINLKDKGFEVFESSMFALRDTAIIIATRNGYSWTGVMWFEVNAEEAVTKEALKVNI